MDMNYFMKIQNAYGTNSHREKELTKINSQMQKHFEDTYDTEDVLINGSPSKLMIIKDTDGNTFKKKIKACRDDKFNLGDYVLWNNQYWLITLLDPDEKTWNRGYMYLCTVPLRWQNSDGKIVERWAYSEDFTKYSSGIAGNNILKIGDNQYGLTLPIDSETKKLNRDKRFAIDFDDTEKPDIYILSNRKVNLNNNQYFGRGGIMTTTMSFDAFNPSKDKHIELENGSQVWICDYHSPTEPPAPPTSNETTDLSISISGGTTLRCGRVKSWAVKFRDKDGNEVTDCDFNWNVVSDFDVAQNVTGQKIQLKVDEEDCIDSSFLLQVVNVNNMVISEVEIVVTEGL